MKLTTIALAISFALPSTFAFAEGSLNYTVAAPRPVVRGDIARHVAIKPRDPSRHVPSGSASNPTAMNHGG